MHISCDKFITHYIKSPLLRCWPPRTRICGWTLAIRKRWNWHSIVDRNVNQFHRLHLRHCIKCKPQASVVQKCASVKHSIPPWLAIIRMETDSIESSYFRTCKTEAITAALSMKLKNAIRASQHRPIFQFPRDPFMSNNTFRMVSFSFIEFAMICSSQNRTTQTKIEIIETAVNGILFIVLSFRMRHIFKCRPPYFKHVKQLHCP